MRLLLDENLSVVTARLLREAGHNVVEIQVVARGAPDPDVIALARETDRLLVSFLDTAEDATPGQFVTVEPDRVRLRPLP